jgi:hypothetical protein
VCFFRPTPRIVQHVLGDDVDPTSASGRAAEDDAAARAAAQPPALVLSGAVQHLSQAARDRPPQTAQRGGDASNILRLMGHLLGGALPRPRSGSRGASAGPGAGTDAYHLMSLRRSEVSVRDAAPLLGFARALAAEYAFAPLAGEDPASVHRKNAATARRHGYLHHARVFGILEAVMARRQVEVGKLSPLAMQMLSKL